MQTAYLFQCLGRHHPATIKTTLALSKSTDQIPQIHKSKAEAQRAKVIKDELDAKRAKTKAARERRQERIQTKRQALAGEDEEETK